jgi:hypothetical protein
VWSVDFSSSSSSTSSSSVTSTSANGNMSNGSGLNSSLNGLVPGQIDTSAPALDPWRYCLFHTHIYMSCYYTMPCAITKELLEVM